MLIVRIFDVSISILILIILLPIMALISLLILLIDGRPIIYKQLRVGYMGRQFTIFKFRTMSKLIFKNEELRVTKLGKISKRWRKKNSC